MNHRAGRALASPWVTTAQLRSLWPIDCSVHCWVMAAPLLSMLLLRTVAAQTINGERGGYGAFCGLEERGCWQDCFEPASKTFVTPPTTATYRTLPFGVDGCCTPTQDPQGSCTAGSCGSKTCVNIATPNVHAFCPSAAAVCQPCAPAQMDLDVCAAHCFDLGYSFSGVEYATQCMCGTHIPVWAKIDSTDMLCRSACASCEGGAQGDRTKECEHCKCPANQEQWCGGGCAITIREVVCSWGTPFLLAAMFGGFGYVAGGIAYAAKTKGKPHALQSHPHYGVWLEVHGLAMDGLQFAQAASHGTQSKPRSTASRKRYGAVAEDERADSRATKTEKHTSSRKEKKKSSDGSRSSREGAKQDRSSHEADAGGGSIASALLPATAPAAAAGPTTATAAGGGGRWVRVPD